MTEKVRITEDSLRVNFIQWISKAIEKKKEKSVKSGNLIIIIDGVDKYLNASGKEESPDWLINEFPPSVRIIFTCCIGSRAHEHLVGKAEIVIEILPLSPQQRTSVYKNLFISNKITETFDKLEEDVTKSANCANPLFLKLALGFCFACSKQGKVFKYKTLDDYSDIESFIIYSIDFISQLAGCQQEVPKFLQSIALSKCGISQEEIKTLLGASQQTVQLLLNLFSPMLHNSEGFYILKHNIFSKIIHLKFGFPLSIHSEMIAILDQHKLTVRKIDEIIHHLLQVKDYMRVKDFLIQLEVFTIMFTSSFKLELYHYWVKLEQQHFDPVQEYNKALEDFVARYSPSSKVFFMLLVQFCRFFKDLAEVESVFTCRYRHPYFRGYYELRDINILEEIETLSGVFSNNLENAARDDDYCTSDGQQTPEIIREKVLKDTLIVQRNPEFYYYKRWIWIQFPWFEMDGSVNFSKSMKNFLYTNDTFSASEEIKLFINLIKLISNTRKTSTREVSRLTSITLCSTPQVTRSQTQTKLSRGLCVFPDIKISSILMPHLEDEIKLGSKSKLSQSVHIFLTDPKDLASSIDIKDTKPTNILYKLTSQMAEFTNKELLIQQKETNELQKSYNRLREVFISKQKTLNSTVSQISKSSQMIKKQQQAQDKMKELEDNIEEVFEKSCQAEEDGKKLQKIVNCCIKNPTRNDEWQRELERILENMTGFIDREKEMIKDVEQETLKIEEQCKVLTSLQSEKNDVQTSTLYRAADTIHINTKIKERIEVRKRRRKIVIWKASQFKAKDTDKLVMQKYENLMKELKNTKRLAKMKIKGYKSMVEKLSVFRKFEDPNSLYEIITTFDKCYQLQDEIYSKRKNIEEFTREKEALELQLQFFQNKKMKEFERSSRYSSFKDINNAIFVKEKRFEDLVKMASCQESSLMKIRIFIENMWKVLRVEGGLVNSDRKIRGNMELIQEKLMRLKEWF